jgi:restriction system protein
MKFGEIQVRMGERMRRLFEILLPYPDGLPRDTALERLLEGILLSKQESGTYPTGGKRINALINVTTANFVKAGWMTKSHRLWRVTPAGEQAFREFTDPLVFIRTATRIKNARFSRFVAAPETAPPVPAPAPAPSPPAIAETVPDLRPLSAATARKRAWSEIRAHVAQMSPYEVQELVADLLRALGWFVAWIAPPGKDGGVDIVGFRDPLGATARRLKVQVTTGDRLLPLPALRSFIALLHEDDIGLFVSVCGFTRDSEEFARVQARRRVTLLDLEGLVELWGQHYAKLDDAARRRLPLQPVWWLAMPAGERHPPDPVTPIAIPAGSSPAP